MSDYLRASRIASRNESRPESLFESFLEAKTEPKSMKNCICRVPFSRTRFERQKYRFLEGPSRQNLGFTKVKQRFPRNQRPSIRLDFGSILDTKNAPKSKKSSSKNQIISEDVFYNICHHFWSHFGVQKSLIFRKMELRRRLAKQLRFGNPFWSIRRPFVLQNEVKMSQHMKNLVENDAQVSTLRRIS